MHLLEHGVPHEYLPPSPPTFLSAAGQRLRVRDVPSAVREERQVLHAPHRGGSGAANEGCGPAAPAQYRPALRSDRMDRGAAASRYCSHCRSWCSVAQPTGRRHGHAGTRWKAESAVFPGMWPNLVAYYDFEHPAPGNPAKEQDKARRARISTSPTAVPPCGCATAPTRGADFRYRHSKSALRSLATMTGKQAPTRRPASPP